MEVNSTTKFVRLSPKKARDVAREIQGLPVSNALDILTFTPKKAAFLIGKTLKTAIADAENNFSLDANSLMIKEAVVNAGPTMRALQAACQRFRRCHHQAHLPHFHHTRRRTPPKRRSAPRRRPLPRKKLPPKRKPFAAAEEATA